MEIKYVTNNQIDKQKWDAVINKSINGFIYSQSFFLDAIGDWDALIAGDYEYLLPLPNKKKFFFKYIYTPQFIGQLGIIGKETTEEICYAFIKAIPLQFAYVDMQLNEYNTLRNEAGAKLIQRTNFTLLLHEQYETLSGNYSKDGKKNLKQSIAHQLSVTNAVTLQTVFDLYKNMYGDARKNTGATDYNNFLAVCEKAIALNKGFVIGVSNADDEIVAAAFFGKDDKRLYYLLGAPTLKGRESNATHFLIDAIIKKYAGTSLELDFEGSDINSVATFYKKFNPKEKKYFHLIINRLPFWARWLKK